MHRVIGADVDPASPRRQVAQGLELVRIGRLVEASSLAENLAPLWPAHPEVLFFVCEARDAIGDMTGALAALEAAIRIVPDQLPLQMRRIDLLLALRRRGEACDAAAALEPVLGHDPRGLRSIGQVFSRCDDPERAGEYLQRALALAPGHPGLLYDLAAAQFFTGEFEAAERNLDEVLARAPGMGQAAYLRATLRTQLPARNHVDALRASLLRGIADPSARAAAFHALAKELEDLGRDEESLRALHEGARAKRTTFRYDVATERDAMEAITRAYTDEAIAAATRGPEQPGPIFVVGMPRTGTTLVERMLGRVPGLRSAGELQDFSQVLASAVQPRLVADPTLSPASHSLMLDFEAVAQDYLRGAREAARGSDRFIDKMPINFLYCGPILLAMPGARIVHLVRDPMDTCYAVYKTLFHQAYHFSYDLDELAEYYIAYRRLMRHWHRVLPDRIVDVRYEDLVSDTETQARRMIDACGLPWRDEVLAPDAEASPSTTASAAQVRQPIHVRSVQKWRRHAEGLEPLRRRLQDAGIVDEHGNRVD